MLNLIKVLLVGFLLSACVGTIEQSDETVGTVDKNPEADFTFNGVDSGLWVSKTKLSVRFLPAFGGGGLFRYQMLDEGGNVLTAENGENLIKDSNGMYHLTKDGFTGSSQVRILVRAIDLESGAPEKNAKYVSINLPSDQYPDFDGIDRCEPFPGADGQSKMNVFWEKGGIYTSGPFTLQNSVGAYKVYYCKKENGTDCLEVDSPDRYSQTVSDAEIENMTVAGMEANTAYYFRVTAVSVGQLGQPETKLEERNIEFFECKTQNASGPIVFDGIQEVNIEDNENGINEAEVSWNAATGGFSAYRVYYHPVVDQSSIFNYSHPDIRSIDIIDTNQKLLDTIGLDSFTHHAFLVRACASLISDPSCTNGSDASGKFIVKQTKPSVASFAGISGTRNDPANPSNVFLDFTPADLASGGIFDEYRVIVSDGTNDYDITESNSSNKLGAIYPSAPVDYRDLYLDTFIKTNIAAVSAKLNGLKPSVVYQADVQACVSRTSPLPISGGNIVVDYCSTGTVPQAVTNNDTTPPQITAMSVTPLAGVIKLTETATFVVTYNEILSISGSPRIGLDVGGVIRYADLISNTATTMTFEYEAQSGDNDLNGLAFDATSISLNGGVISDLSGNNASLNFVAVAPDLSSILVDTIPPDAPTNVVFTKIWLSSVDPIQQASWTNPINDFDHADVGIGSSGSGSANVVPFVASSGTNNHTFPDVTAGLVECAQEYEVVVRSVDAAGLFSSVASSPLKFRLDKTAPSVALISLDGTTSDVFVAPEVSWSVPTDNCLLDHYEISIGRDDDADGFDAGDVDNVMAWTEIPGGIGISDYVASSGIDGMSFSMNAVDNFRVSIRAVDAAGNPSIESSTPDFIVDIAGPSTPTGLTIANQWISGPDPIDSPLFSWINPTEPDFQHNKVSLGSTIGADDIRSPQNVGTFTSYTWTGLTGLTECDKNFPKIVAFDDIGNPSAAGTSPSVWFAIDNTDPIITGNIDISAGGEDLATNTAPFTDFSPAFQSDNCSAIDFFEISIGYDDDADGFDPGDVANTLAFTEIPGGDGVVSYQPVNGIDGMFFSLAPGRDYYVSLRIVDKAGNTSSHVSSATFFSFVLDNTAPDVAITSSALNPTSSSPFPITITFTEDVTGFDVSDIVVTNGSAGGFAGGPSVFTANITPSDFGRVYVDINAGVAQDGAANPNTAAPQFSLIYASSDTFRSIWNMSAGSFTLPLRSGQTYDFFVDWGDGSPAGEVTAHNDPDATHSYAAGGTYTITCTGKMGAFYINNNGSVDTKITSVTSLGEMGWENLDSAFEGATNLLSFSGGVVDQVTDMEQMFRNAQSLSSVNISSWNTGNVVDMYLMFENAYLANPDVSGWDVSSVTRFNQMFDDAESANPNTSSWDTSSATQMQYMFRDTIVANPDVSGWDVSNVNSFYAMFQNADGATPNTSSWNTANAQNMGTMFRNAALANPDVSGWDTGNVTNMQAMFEQADSATPDTSSWDTSKVINMSNMFYRADIANPNTASWDTSKVTQMQYMFREAPMANPNTSAWDTSRVTNMEHMFYNADLANPDTSAWDTSLVTRMDYMFYGTAVANPDTSGWDTSKVVEMDGMFYLALQANPNTAGWDTGLVVNMYRMFRQAPLANPNTTGWDVSKVTNMEDMFYDADSANPNTSSWNTGNVTNMNEMFAYTDLANPDTSSWDVSKVTNMIEMFRNSQAADPDTSAWVTTSVTRLDGMFRQAQVADPVMSSWDVSNVTEMDYMFYLSPNATATSTGSWDTSSVTRFRGMFYRASIANPNTALWDTSSATDMREMFREANSANPDVSGWVTAQTTDMYYMFYNSPSVNPDMSTWSFAGSPNMTNMLRGNLSSMTNANYSAYLNAIDATTPNGANKRVDANTLEYQPSAAAARANMISNGWTINDNGAE